MAETLKLGTIERAIAITEIHQSLHRYCNLAREEAPFDEMAKLFLPTGIFRLPNGLEVAPADMGRVVQGKPPTFIRHHVTTIVVDFVSTNEARTDSLFLAHMGAPAIDHWGRWRDVFVKAEDGRWLIKDRSIVVEGADPAGWYAETYGVPT